VKNLTVIFALGCASTLIATQSVAAYESADSSYHENSIPIQNKPDAWASVERDTLRYPSRASSNSTSGCATVNYILTPSNEVKDVRVVKATDRGFAQAAKRAIEKWDFSKVDGAFVETDTPKQTRFEFCKDVSTETCLVKQKSYCDGDDVIAAVHRSVNPAELGNTQQQKSRVNRAMTFERKFQ
jgi:TonB family protein